MRWFLCTLSLLFLHNFAYCLGDVDPDIEFKRALYTLPEGKNHHDVTELVLSQSTIPEADKQRFIEKNRRFFVFSYPSDGMEIKSLISFVEGSEDPSHIMFLRGSGQFEAIPNFSPYDANYPYLHTTDATLVLASYRDGLCPGFDEYGGRDVHDVINLTNYLPTLAENLSLKFDWEKFYAVGVSRGGMQLFLALSRFPEFEKKVAKVVSNCGLLDTITFTKHNPELYKQFKAYYKFKSNSWIKKRSALHNVKNMKRKELPILILHGTDDVVVSIEQPLKFLKRLKKLGFKSVQYEEVPEGNHVLLNKNAYAQYVCDWLFN